MKAKTEQTRPSGRSTLRETRTVFTNGLFFKNPVLIGALGLYPVVAAGFAIGTGVAFFLAALVLSEALARYRNEYMPKAFRGLPSVLIYVGILSMVFVGVTGGRLFG